MSLTPPLFVSTKPDGPDASKLRPTDWNNLSNLITRIFGGAQTNGFVLTKDSTVNDGVAWKVSSGGGGGGTTPTGTGYSHVTAGVLDVAATTAIPQADITNLSSDLAGKIVGPASSTDNAVVLFSGTTGKLVKDSGGVVVRIKSIAIDNQQYILGRNTLNTADINMFRINASNTIDVGAKLETADINGQIFTGTQFTASGAGGFSAPAGGFFSIVGRGYFDASGNGLWRFQTSSGAAGVGFDIVTDAIFKVRTRAHTGYATIDALGYSVSGVAGASKAAGPVTSITVVNGIVTACT